MNSKQFSILLGIVIVALLAIIGYLTFRSNPKPEIAQTQNNNQNNSIETPSNTANDSNKNNNSQTPPVKLPVIAFIPDVFSNTEKQQIQTRLLDPLIDWNKDSPETDYHYVSITVKKTDSLDYKYSINSVSANGGWGGFLYGTDSQAVIPLWTPDCMGRCTFSESFKKKYPEVVSEYNKKNPN